MKHIALFALTFFLVVAKSSAQCDTLKLIDDINVSDIESPDQLMFIHRPPRTNVDHFVAAFLEEKDSAQLVKLVDAIGATRSPEAYCLLYTACCRPLFIKDLNPFNGFTGLISFYGGYRVLNKYFLNNRVTDTLNDLDFANAVFLECRKNEPTCYYCKPEDELLRYKRELSRYETRVYDYEIVRVIKEHSDLKRFGGNPNQALDSMVLKLQSLEFVGEAMWDKCEEKLPIVPFPYTIGVIIMIDDVPVEKSYTVKFGDATNPDKLIYTGNAIDPGFIYRQVDLCNPD